MDVLVIYRSPNPAYQKYLRDIKDNLLSHITRYQTVICGDFNIDFRKNPNNLISQTLNKEGFSQIVKHPTTIHGTTLDHVYVRGNRRAEYFLHYPYYTDHEAVCVTLKKECKKK